ncbi:MAG TPA: glycosyl hydrolase family 18 protein [Rhodanobacteraceae bacterium]|nr:glycosyl hydrolase family 18 protein [Rhodanobacteraceae bacterium]
MRSAVVALLLALVLPCVVGVQAAEPVAPYRVVGYDFGASWVPGETDTIPWKPIPASQARELDTIIFAFAGIKNGRVVLTDTGARRLDSLVALKKVNPHLRVELSVGGWGAGGFSEAASTAGGRQLFAASATQLVVQHHLDGLDVDWEFPGSDAGGITASPDDRGDFTLLLAAVRSSLDAAAAADGHAYSLSIAAGLGNDLRDVDIAAINRYLDSFNVMTYDMCNKEPPGVHVTCHHSGLDAGPSAPAYVDTVARGVWQFISAGVPPRKLVIGAAFYGHAYGDVTPKDDGLYQPYAKALDLGELSWPRVKAGFMDTDGFVRHWDPDAQAAWSWNAATHTFVTYDDPQSMAAKAAFVKANHLGGIMFWQLGDDPSGELLHAIAQGLDGGAAPATAEGGGK